MFKFLFFKKGFQVWIFKCEQCGLEAAVNTTQDNLSPCFLKGCRLVSLDSKEVKPANPKGNQS